MSGGGDGTEPVVPYVEHLPFGEGLTSDRIHFDPQLAREQYIPVVGTVWSEIESAHICRTSELPYDG